MYRDIRQVQQFILNCFEKGRGREYDVLVKRNNRFWLCWLLSGQSHWPVPSVSWILDPPLQSEQKRTRKTISGTARLYIYIQMYYFRFVTYWSMWVPTCSLRIKFCLYEDCNLSFCTKRAMFHKPQEMCFGYYVFQNSLTNGYVVCSFPVTQPQFSLTSGNG